MKRLSQILTEEMDAYNIKVVQAWNRMANGKTVHRVHMGETNNVKIMNRALSPTDRQTFIKEYYSIILVQFDELLSSGMSEDEAIFIIRDQENKEDDILKEALKKLPEYILPDQQIFSDIEKLLLSVEVAPMSTGVKTYNRGDSTYPWPRIVFAIELTDESNLHSPPGWQVVRGDQTGVIIGKEAPVVFRFYRQGGQAHSLVFIIQHVDMTTSTQAADKFEQILEKLGLSRHRGPGF